MLLRQAAPNELGTRLSELIDQVERHQSAPPFGEVLLAAMQDSETKSQGLAWEEEGRLLSYAFASVNPDGRVWTLEIADNSGEGERFLEALAERLPSVGIDEAVLWLHTPTIEPPPAWYTHERDLYRMATGLPITVPSVSLTGVKLAGFRVERDAEALIEVNNLAFQGHPEQGNWSKSDLERRVSLPWFDPKGVRTAWVEGRLAAFHWTKVHEQTWPDGGVLGEIYVLAVDPAFHKRGLGRAIALDGLEYLYRERQATRAILYVDAANQAAVNLYRKLGFKVEHTDRAYRWTSSRGSRRV